jgi:epoxyqueuosine reductase
VELTRKVKEMALANNLDYVGIASVESLQNEPLDRKPTDYLPGAQTVVSFGIKLSLGAQLSNRLAHEIGPRHAIFPYLWHGYGLPSWQFLDRTAVLITRLLEKEGYIAVPITSGSIFDIQSNLMEFSNLHAAVAAGLGDLGWCGLVLTPDAGPKARFGAVITTAKLDTDNVYQGPRLCDVDNCRKQGGGTPLCAKVCPTGAFGKDSEVIVIGDKTFNIAKYNRFRCMWGSMGLVKESLGLQDLTMPDEVSVEDVYDVLAKRDPVQSLELICINERGDYCGKCIMACPVGTSSRVDEKISQVKKKRRA